MREQGAVVSRSSFCQKNFLTRLLLNIADTVITFDIHSGGMLILLGTSVNTSRGLKLTMKKIILLLIVGLALFFLGTVLIASSPFSGHTITRTIGLFLMIAGGVLFGLAIVQAYKKRMELNNNNMGGKKAVTAAMGMQAQAEYNRRLTAYSKEGAPADEPTQAKLFAQAVLMLSLGAPSTAAFSDLDAAVAGSNSTYTVTGWVDAQNIFGVMMRESFSMRVFKKDGVWQTGR